MRFIKDDVTRFSLSYIVFVDKEHCPSNCEGYISTVAKKYGISIHSIQKIAGDLDMYKLKCSVGNKKFFVYFILLGFYCCIEDFILIKICNINVSPFTGEGCCKKYKKIFKRIQKEKRELCIRNSYDEIFHAIAYVFDELKRSL